MRSNLLRIFGLLVVALAFTLIVSEERARALIDPPTTGKVNDIPAPPSVCLDDAVYGTTIAAFNEKQHVRLPGPGNVFASAPSPKFGGIATYNDVSDLDQTFAILPNSVVNSHYLHRQRLNPNDPSNPSLGTVSFDSDIIAVIVQGNDLGSTDVLLGASGTCYPTGLSGRALEMDSDVDYVKYLGARTLEVQFDTTNVIDAIRVITEGNRAPVADDDNPSFAEGSPMSGSVAGNDSDPDGAALTWSLVTSPGTGSVNLQSNGSFTYTPPNPDFNGIVTFTYEACDPVTGTTTFAVEGLCDMALVTLTVTPVNDPPVINSVAPTTATEDVLYTYNATRTDVDGPGQTWSLLGSHTCGGSIVAGTDVFTFTPAGPVPPASCVRAVQVCDGGTPNLCAQQTTTITITAVNDAPVINSSAPASATEGALYTYNVTRDDADGPSQSWTLFGSHTCGGSIVPGTGVFTFTPQGPVPPASCVVAMRVCDGGTPNLCGTQTTTIAITAVNDAPFVNSFAPATATEDTLYTYNATRYDPDGPSQSWSLLGSHTCGGSIVPGTGIFTFTPAGPVPPASCEVAVRVCDLGAPNLCAQDSTTITITAANDAPVVDSSAPPTATEDVLYTYNATRIDPDGPGQTWSLLGSHTCGGSIVAGTGVLTFTPAGPVPPASCVVAVQICDLGTPNLCHTQTTTVTITAVNDAPGATNLNAPETYIEDMDLDLTDIVVDDVDSATVTVTISLPSGSVGSFNTATAGSVTSTYNGGTGEWGASGAISDVNALLSGLTFTPAQDYNDDITITVDVTDGDLSVNGNKPLTGTPVNDAPVAGPDVATIESGDGTVIDLRVNDVEGPANESTQSLYVASFTPNAHVTANIIAGGPDAGKILLRAVAGDCPTGHAWWVAPTVDLDADCVDDTIEAAVGTNGVAGPYVFYDGAPVTLGYTVCDDGVPSECDTETVMVSFAQDIDTDDDGCSDLSEVLNNPDFGGQRHPGNWWDFLDVSGDGAIDITDAVLVDDPLHYGHGPTDDALDHQWDRDWTSGGELGGRFIVVEANNGIDLTDVINVLGQFGATCTPPGPTPAPGGGIY